MIDDPNTNQEKPAPDSVQPIISEPAKIPSEAIEVPRNEAINEPNAPSKNEDIRANESSSVKPNLEPVSEQPISERSVSEPAQMSEPRTAQIPVFEPFAKPEEIPSASLESKPTSFILKPSQKDLWRRFLDKVNIRKRKKLDRIMTMFAKQVNITNDEVEKFLHVSDATATRYLSILEKEGKIKQSGKTGKGVSYSK